jgi:hypothetical protein
MRRPLGNVLTVLALAISAIAGGEMRSPHAASAGKIGLVAIVPGACCDSKDPTVPLTQASTQDPADQDVLGPEREAPGALPAFDLTALDAPRSSRVEHRATPAEAAVSRSILPVVQPPRG